MRKILKAIIEKQKSKSTIKNFIGNPDNFKYEMMVNDGSIWIKISPLKNENSILK